jgi:hypothetical protein
MSLPPNVRVQIGAQSVQKVHLFNTKKQKMSDMGQLYLLPNHTQASLLVIEYTSQSPTTTKVTSLVVTATTDRPPAGCPPADCPPAGCPPAVSIPPADCPPAGCPPAVSIYYRLDPH